MEEELKKRGGKREGAGRKLGKKQQPISVRIDNDLLPFLAEQSNKNRFINDCIREKRDMSNK